MAGASASAGGLLLSIFFSPLNVCHTSRCRCRGTFTLRPNLTCSRFSNSSAELCGALTVKGATGGSTIPKVKKDAALFVIFKGPPKLLITALIDWYVPGERKIRHRTSLCARAPRAMQSKLTIRQHACNTCEERAGKACQRLFLKCVTSTATLWESLFHTDR